MASCAAVGPARANTNINAKHPQQRLHDTFPPSKGTELAQSAEALHGTVVRFLWSARDVILSPCDRFRWQLHLGNTSVSQVAPSRTEVGGYSEPSSAEARREAPGARAIMLGPTWWAALLSVAAPALGAPAQRFVGIGPGRGSLDHSALSNRHRGRLCCSNRDTRPWPRT